jgi:hypothetical protein
MNSLLPVHDSDRWLSRPRSRPRVAIVVDPRFPGGTSAAVAAEIDALAPVVDLRVHAIETRMFSGRHLHPAIAAACASAGIEPVWDAPVVRADTIVFHNPSSLRFDSAPPPRMSCQRALVVTHENFERPGGAESFDVDACLGLLERALVAGERQLAPVSPHNRRTVERWLARSGTGWALAPADWFNIVDEAPVPPASAPRDRRGRHSRPGLEKFPPLDDLRRQFPEHAERCVILGGDSLLHERALVPSHWEVRPFVVGELDRFFADIDFYVYYTNPAWRESFGRAVAEAIVAGKVVITDPGTAEVFGSAVVAADADEVDAVIGRFLSDPGSYAAFVRAAQREIRRFRPDAFRAMALRAIGASRAPRHALV